MNLTVFDAYRTIPSVGWGKFWRFAGERNSFRSLQGLRKEFRKIHMVLRLGARCAWCVGIGLPLGFEPGICVPAVVRPAAPAATRPHRPAGGFPTPGRRLWEQMWRHRLAGGRRRAG